MIIECTSCGSKYKYDESKLAGATSKKVKCPKCKGVIEVSLQNAIRDDVPADPDRLQQTIAAVSSPASFQTQSAPAANAKQNSVDHTAPSMPAMPQESPKTSKVRRDSLMGATDPTGASAENFLKLPDYRKISLAVISGSNSGEIYQINKPRMVLGRTDAEIVVKDPEASRAHARIDVMGDRVILRDLNSTNGTFVNEQKISTTTLENHSEFRIGTTIFMLIITEVE